MVAKKRIKDNISNCQSVGRVISVSRQERAESRKVTLISAIAALVTFRGNHNYQSLIETCKNWWEALIQLSAAVQRLLGKLVNKPGVYYRRHLRLLTIDESRGDGLVNSPPGGGD